MASPGRIVQKGGKTVYERLDSDDGSSVDAGGLSADPKRSFANCPSEHVTWPEYDASCVSRLFFAWFNPIVKLGATVPLEMSDLWVLHRKESAAKNVPEFMELWRQEQERARAAGTTPGLLRPVWYFAWRIVVPAGVLLLSGCLTQFVRPLLMMQ